MKYAFCFVIGLCLAGGSRTAWAARASASSPYRDFEKVCLSVFAQRSSDAANSAGKQICACTSRESRHQGVTVPELRRETEEIRKDPRYKIRNPKLLASFHYCVIMAMDQRAHELDGK